MQTLPHSKAIVTFEQNILWIKFNQGIDIEVKDMKDIYAFALQNSKGESYCVLFETSGTLNLSEAVVEYVAKNPDKAPIIAKAYVVNSDEHKSKTRLHVAFDKPVIKPGIFSSKKEAIDWLQTFLKK